MSDDNSLSAAAIEATNILKRINNTAKQVESAANNATNNAATAVTKLNSASTSATQAATHASNAQAKATESSTSAGTAKTKESEIKVNAAGAQTSATEAASSAKVAKDKANEATSSATEAQQSAVTASNSTTTSKTKAGESTLSAEIAKEKELEAIGSAKIAKDKEDESIASAAIAKDKEDEATGSANIAKTKETEASTSAKEAKRSAADAAEAHNLSTTTGLAGAFNLKAEEALIKMGYAGIALFVALTFVGAIGYSKFDKASALITDLIANDKVLEAIAAQVLFFLMGVAAPLWLAWMATKMISKYFQLSEDYSYKASLAKAYIGFKEQADGLDPIFEERLFAAAITQLDANPLRFFEESSHSGSPIQDLLQQPFMIAALKKDSFRSSISKWMNNRFKTNFHVERTDILDTIPKDLLKAADTFSDNVTEVAGKIK